MTPTDWRTLRIPLPSDLIARLDQVVDDGVGGFTSREQLVREAVEAMVTELMYPPAPERPHPYRDQKQIPRLQEMEEQADSDGLAWTALATIRDEPLFGVHNRDYPSLWVASRLAEVTQEDLVSAEFFYRHIIGEAWEFARRLQGLVSTSGLKVDALFPTNRVKPESASSLFLNFALGSHTGEDHDIVASGPLFLWRVLQLETDEDSVLVGITEIGKRLLDRMEGLTAEMPHQSEYAVEFFKHLQGHAEPDWKGFQVLLASVAEGASRAQVAEHFQTRWPDWTVSKVATNVAGYVARAREWGVLAPKLMEGKYQPTDFGRQIFQ
jgi:hypothetical protein